MVETILDINNLSIQFKTPQGIFHAVENVSFSIEPGDILGIVGESGCGKSVTSLSLMGLLPDSAFVTADQMTFQDKDILSLNDKEKQQMRGKDMSMIFQEPMTSLNPLIRIGTQIAESARIHLGLNKQEAKARSIDMLQKVGLSDAERLYRRYPHELSGGMRQRIMIAMAVICAPKLLIADEPTTALDVTIQAQILELMKNINKQDGTSVIFISHDLGVIKEICTKVLVMYAGQVVESASAEQLFQNSQHPYTQGLMASIPTPEKKNKPLYAIPGRVPSLTGRKAGCLFAPRCSRTAGDCRDMVPLLNRADSNHLVSCFYPGRVED